MRDPLVDALRAALAEGSAHDAALRRAVADLRETCAFALDPRHAERDLARLLARSSLVRDVASPVAARFEAVWSRLPSECLESAARAQGHPSAAASPLLAEGLESLSRSELGMALCEMRVLDPWAGDGALLAPLGAAERFGNVADPADYARALPEGTVCLADSFNLPGRDPTPGFAFSDDENTERIALQQATEFEIVASDLRGVPPPDPRARRRVRETYGEGLAAVRWMSDRLAPRGIVAFVSDGAFVDSPALAGMRGALEREFGGVWHVAPGMTFLVRGGRRRGIFYARTPVTPDPSPQEGRGETPYADIDWQELEPTPGHVWRTEILAPEWSGFLPLAGERGAIFGGENVGAPDGRDAPVAGAKGARRVMRQPFAPAWRVLDRATRREPWPDNGPTMVVVQEPFGVFATSAPVDRRFGRAPLRAISGAVSPSALRRFRAEYGAGVVERDVFDYALALLHHPAYRVRYHEDLRRSVPRVPLVAPERLQALAEIEDAPPVGPGTAFGTGWLDPDDFEPGSVPDYDDPFASPYARSDVEPGFLLLCGLGAALYRVQNEFERLLPFPLERIESVGFEARVERMRLSGDRTRLIVTPGLTLSGIPPEAFAVRMGARSGLEWAVEAYRAGRDFDPNLPEEPERLVRRMGQVVAAGIETERLAGIVGVIDLIAVLP